MTAQVAADLRAAADVLERDGWAQGTYHREDGCHCADGAIAVAAGAHLSWEFTPNGELVVTVEGGVESRDRWGAAFGFASDFVTPEAQRSEIGSLIGWNDQSGRTAAEVIAALRAAADAAEADQ